MVRVCIFIKLEVTVSKKLNVNYVRDKRKIMPFLLWIYEDQT